MSLSAGMKSLSTNSPAKAGPTTLSHKLPLIGGGSSSAVSARMEPGSQSAPQHRRPSTLAHSPPTNPPRDGAGKLPSPQQATRTSKPNDKWVVGKQFPIMPHELFFMAVRNEEKVLEIQEWQRVNIVHGDRVFFCPDDELQYFPFCADFGPLNFGMTFRFICMLRAQLDMAKRQGKMVVYYTMADAVSRTNAATLIALYLVIERGWTAEEAMQPLTFGGKQPFLHYRDASFQPVTFELTILDIARGVEKAKANELINMDTFDIELYEYCDHPSMADLHVIVPGKFLAMKGPHARSYFKDGVQFLAPSHYFDMFRKLGVSAVVRLNNEQYDAETFRTAGFNHYDIYFDDCTVPDRAVLDQWWEVCRKEKGTIAVHCKAGLGRTGTLICLWLMRKYKFTGREAIGYNRVMRPGSILGPQQDYLLAMQQEMWDMGDPDAVPKSASLEVRPPDTKRQGKGSFKIRSSNLVQEEKDKQTKDQQKELSRILAQENTDAMNRRAAQMTGTFTRPPADAKAKDGGKRYL